MVGTLGEIPTSVLEAVVTPSCLHSLLIFCRKYNLHINDPPPLQPPRAQDRLLMPIWVDLGYTKSQLHNLRSCMYHKDAMWISDLTEADGLHFLQESYSSTTMPARHHPDPSKPNVAPKHQLDWPLWNNALDTLVSRSRWLLTPLGPWFLDNPQLSSWKWWYCSDEDRLYSHQGLRWISVPRYINSRSSRHLFKNPAICETIPTSLQHATVSPWGTCLALYTLGFQAWTPYSHFDIIKDNSSQHATIGSLGSPSPFYFR